MFPLTPFVKSQMPVMLDSIGKRYGKLPHELLDVPGFDLLIDYVCLQKGIEAENRRTRK